MEQNDVTQVTQWALVHAITSKKRKKNLVQADVSQSTNHKRVILQPNVIKHKKMNPNHVITSYPVNEH